MSHKSAGCTLIAFKAYIKTCPWWYIIMLEKQTKSCVFVICVISLSSVSVHRFDTGWPPFPCLKIHDTGIASEPFIKVDFNCHSILYKHPIWKPVAVLGKSEVTSQPVSTSIRKRKEKGKKNSHKIPAIYHGKQRSKVENLEQIESFFLYMVFYDLTMKHWSRQLSEFFYYSNERKQGQRNSYITIQCALVSISSYLIHFFERKVNQLTPTNRYVNNFTSFCVKCR